jgi:hypothetical protein
MTVDKPVPVPPCTQGPPLDVRSWLRCRLLEAGFEVDLAEAVAADSRYDVHALLDLVARGCPPRLAVQIVSPLAVDRSR